MFYGMTMTLANSMGELAIVVKVVGLSTLLWILVYPHLLSLPHYLNALILADWGNSATKS
jgi:hypothetical protein